MKKTYIIPAVNVVRTDMESNLMATSLVIDPGKSGGDALVKGNDWADIWDDEEDNTDE